MTVFTELTNAGKKTVAPSVQAPIYYVAMPDGFYQEGQRVGNERPPSPPALDYFVRKALAAGGYLPVPSMEVRPTVLILYRWGSHNAPSASFTSDMPEFANVEVLERARLVGGRKLVREMAQTMQNNVSIRDDTKDYLKAQAFASCYFVVVFAYDYEASVRGERKLYWRTNMTVSSSGVSLKESLGPLIASAGPFFGKEMAEPEITTRWLKRGEKIEIGEATVVETFSNPEHGRNKK